MSQRWSGVTEPTSVSSSHGMNKKTTLDTSYINIIFKVNIKPPGQYVCQIIIRQLINVFPVFEVYPGNCLHPLELQRHPYQVRLVRAWSRYCLAAVKQLLHLPLT